MPASRCMTLTLAAAASLGLSYGERRVSQYHWNPETYLEQARAEVPRFDELQRAAIDAIPFAPEQVLELGMGTGETTRVLLESYPDAWVIGLDASPEMVFRLRQEYDGVMLARMEDPLPDGPWDLVISVLSIHHLTDDQKQTLFRRVREQAKRAGDRGRRQGRRAGDADPPGARLPRLGREAGRVVRRRGDVARGRPCGRPRNLRLSRRESGSGRICRSHSRYATGHAALGVASAVRGEDLTCGSRYAR